MQFFLTYAQLNFDEESLEENLKLAIQLCKSSLRVEKNIVDLEPIDEASSSKIDALPLNMIQLERKSAQSTRQNSPSVLNQVFADKQDIESLGKHDFQILKQKSKKSLFPIFFDSKAWKARNTYSCFYYYLIDFANNSI